MKTLIAGLGSIGRRHLRNLLVLGMDDVVLYRTYRSTLPDDELEPFPVETDYQAALAHKPDAVIIANPSSLHLELAIPAAKAGCNLLLEKPISDSLDRLPELVSAIEVSRSRVLVGFQFRYHPVLQDIEQVLAQGKIGRPLSVRAHWGEYLPNWHPWEDYKKSYTASPDLGGGVILTLCHPLDYLRMLFGEIDRLWCFIGNQSDLGIQVEDTAEIGLIFKNGIIGSVHLNYVQRPTKHDLEIIGTEGTIYWDNADGTAYILNGVSGELNTINPPEGFERNDLFMAEMRDFIDMVKTGSSPRCILNDGIQALKLALGALSSAKDGKIYNCEQ